MHNVHLVGCASTLFDNLALSWTTGPVACEITDLDSLPAAIDQIHARRPEWIVYCGRAAHSSWEAIPASHADDSMHVELLARTTAEVDARLAVISSDRVLGGPRMFKDESEPAACDAQAQQMQAIEQAALALDVDRRRVLVVRTNAFGWSAAGESFAERIWRSLDERGPLELDSSSYATPILASDLAELLVRCFRARLHGVLHIGGAERTSPYRFAQELARAAGFDHRLVRVSEQRTPEGEPILSTCETSLASRLVRRELDVSLPLLRESVARLALQVSDGHRDRIRAVRAAAFSRAA